MRKEFNRCTHGISLKKYCEKCAKNWRNYGKDNKAFDEKTKKGDIK